MAATKYSDRQIEIMQAATVRIHKYGIQELTTKNLAADLHLSEAALYRHFKSKNEILLGLLNYFIADMETRVNEIVEDDSHTYAQKLKNLFDSQLKSFVQNPAIVSVIFAEGIFQNNKILSARVSYMMQTMQKTIGVLVKEGQKNGTLRKLPGESATTTIIMGSMRMTVLKWKLSGHKSNLVKDGKMVLNGILKLLEK